MKNYYNLNNINCISIYSNRPYPFISSKKKGYYWWKLLGIIPIIRLYRKKTIYHNIITQETFTEEDILLDNNLTIDKNEEVIYKPHILIYFTGDNIHDYADASYRKFFDTQEEADVYINSLISNCKLQNIILKEF